MRTQLGALGFLCLSLPYTCSALPIEGDILPRTVLSPVTADSNTLRTWWHDNADANLDTSVAPGDVRQSHLYTVKVNPSNEDANVATPNKTYYDSFVYSAIPRNGNGNLLTPDDPSSATNNSDGITVEAALGMSMSWTQFLYSEDVTIKISRSDISNATAQDINIKPSSLNYAVSDDEGNIYIEVPFSSQGVRFSVEYADNSYDFRTQCTDPSDCYFVDTFSDDDMIVGREPLNALMIFGSPFPPPEQVPDTTAESTLVVEPGLVTGLDQTQAETVYFGPGIYYLTATAHANLSSTVNWVHLNAGAYVKGAFQFNSASSSLRFTGHGVLSGEQYVYQANPFKDYTNYKDDNCLKMIQGYSTFNIQQSFQLIGPTLASPPYNTFDFTGELNTISLEAYDYKQVGSYFAQTDGLTVLPNSHVHDVFYHSNDDTIKTYYSNSLTERVTVWKGTTAPVIQFGWMSRNITNITVNDVSVIHTRWNSNISHPSIIGANQEYGASETTTNTADLTNTVSNLHFSNINVDSINGGNLFRIVPLSTIKNLTIENVYINAYPPVNTGMRDSQLPAWYDASGNQAGIEGFTVQNFIVAGNSSAGGGGSAVLSSSSGAGDGVSILADTKMLISTTVTEPTVVDFGNDNWGVGELGSLNIASSYLDNAVQILA